MSILLILGIALGVLLFVTGLASISGAPNKPRFADYVTAGLIWLGIFVVGASVVGLVLVAAYALGKVGP